MTQHRPEDQQMMDETDELLAHFDPDTRAAFEAFMEPDGETPTPVTKDSPEAAPAEQDATQAQNGTKQKKEEKKHMTSNKATKIDLNKVRALVASLKKSDEPREREVDPRHIKFPVGKTTFRLTAFDDGSPWCENRGIELGDRWFCVNPDVDAPSPIKDARIAAFKRGDKVLGKRLYGKQTYTFAIVIDGVRKFTKLSAGNGGDALVKLVGEMIDEGTNIFDGEGHDVTVVGETAPMNDGTYTKYSFRTATKSTKCDAAGEPLLVADHKRTLANIDEVMTVLNNLTAS